MKDQPETVALTCPKISHDQLELLPKCCLANEMLASIDDSGIDNVMECKPGNKSWKLPINGHLYDSTQLWNQKILVNDKRSKVSHSLNHFLLVYKKVFF